MIAPAVAVNVALSPVVITSPLVEMPVAPVNMTAPSESISPAPPMVRLPTVAFKVTVPVPVVKIPVFTVTISLLTETPRAPDVVVSPVNVVVPVPAACVKLTDVKSVPSKPIATSSALTMVTAPRVRTSELKKISPAPAVKVRSCAATLIRMPLKVRSPPAVVIPTAPVVVVTVSLKITLSFEVVKFTPAIVAALTTVNALLKLEEAPWNDTPAMPEVRVVMPVIVPPPVTPFTVIAAPFAVMFNAPAPVLVMKSSSASVRLKPATNVPKETAVAALLVMLTAPFTLIAAPIETSPALAMVRDES